MDRAVAALTKELLDLAAPQPGERVLDIGCSPGTTVLELAKHVGPGGDVLGADVSEPSVARARERIAAAGVRHAEIIVADASVYPFPPDSFELTFSRFGIMFFSDPVAAFENVRRAMNRKSTRLNSSHSQISYAVFCLKKKKKITKIINI